VADEYQPTCWKCGKPVVPALRNTTRIRTCHTCQQKRRAAYDDGRRDRLKALRYESDRTCRRCGDPLPDETESYWCRQCRQIASQKNASAAILYKDGIRDEPEPTNALPGSPEKIEVLMRRIAAGKSPWARQDFGFRGWEYD
jgi:Zn finger protein HypA/HybF involved in hydrogenase expression